MLRITALMTVLLAIAGCAGITSFEPRDNREEGPERGLFTGSQGEWVILAPKAPPGSDGERKDAAQGSEADHEETKLPETTVKGE